MRPFRLFRAALGPALAFITAALALVPSVEMSAWRGAGSGSASFAMAASLMDTDPSGSNFTLYIVVAAVAFAGAAVALVIYFRKLRHPSQPKAEAQEKVAPQVAAKPSEVTPTSSQPESAKTSPPSSSPVSPTANGAEPYGSPPARVEAPPPPQPVITIVKEQTPPPEVRSPPPPPPPPPRVVEQETYRSPPPPPPVVVPPEPVRAPVVQEPPKPVQAAPAPVLPATTTEAPKISMMRKDMKQDPIDWILDCVGGYGFWSLSKGPLPKSELEVEFKKKYPNTTFAEFSSTVYDLIYKDKLSSEMSGSVMILQLTPATRADKAAQWTAKKAKADMLQAQLAVQTQGPTPGEKRKQWIEIKPQAELGDGGPWDDLNRQMGDLGWFGRTLTSGDKDIKSMMWHREPPYQELQPPKAYYPNILVEWRLSASGKQPSWHIEGVNISEAEFRRRIGEKSWSEWLGKNKVAMDIPTWEEAIVRVLEMGQSYVR